jgi:mono/diheme cytochrome c family protein
MKLQRHRDTETTTEIQDFRTLTLVKSYLTSLCLCVSVVQFHRAAIALTFALCFISPLQADEPVSFTSQIAPLLVKHCQACHGPRDPKGGYQLTTFNLLMKPGESDAAAVTPGKPAESELLNLICSTDADARMPKDADALTAEQIALVRRWIEEGAKFDSPDPAAALTAIIPKLPQPDPPAAYRRPVPITALAFSPDGQELAVGGYHEITIYNVASSAAVRRIKNVAERVLSLAYNADGSLLAAAGGSPGSYGEVKLFRPQDGSLVRELGTMGDVAFRAVFNPASTKLAVGGADRTIRIYDVATGSQERLIEDHADWVVSLAYNHDGTRLASAARDKTSKLFNAETGESLTTFSGHGEAVLGVGFNADGKRIFVCGAAKKAQVWNPDDGAKTAEAGGFARDVTALITSADKTFVAAADGTVRQFRGDGLQAFKTYSNLPDAAFCVAYNAATQRVAGGSLSGEVRIWNAEDGAQIASFIAAPGYVPPAAPAPPAAAAK